MSMAGHFFFSAAFPVFIGAGNTFFAERNRMNRKLRKANEEVEHLAKVAERERIARDLHDVLGHTLSVITLKSELAGKLIDRDPAARGKGNSRSRTDFAPGSVRRARRDSRISLPGTCRRTGTSQIHARNRRPHGSVRCRNHHETSGRAGKRSLARRARGRDQRCPPRAGPHLPLRLEQQNGSCRLEIQDDGQGILQRRRQRPARHARARRNAGRHSGAHESLRHHAHHHSALERSRRETGRPRI